MNAVKFVVNVNSAQYAGSLTVALTDSTGASVYSGTLATYTTTWAAPKFPLSITVTATSAYLVYTQSNIADASNLVIALIAAPTSSVTYAVLAGSSAYTGAITVLIKDVNSVTVYSGAQQTFTATILTSALPISITVTPAALYQVYT